MVTQTPSTSTATAPQPNAAVMVPNNHRFLIPGDTVRRAIEDLPPEPRDPILWFYGWCRKADLSKPDLGQVLKKPDGGGFYSTDSIVQLLTGGRIRKSCCDDKFRPPTGTADMVDGHR